MSDQGPDRGAETDHRDRSDVGERPAPSGAGQDRISAWLLLIDVGLTGLIASILAGVVSMGVFWIMEAIRAFSIDPMRPAPPLELEWVVAGGVAVGLLFMAGTFGRRPEADKERVLQVACTLFLCGALVAGAIAFALLNAAVG